MKEILLVSDQIHRDKDSILRLESEYKVDATAYVSTAWYKLRKPERYSLIIIEVRDLNCNTYSLKETSDGRKTGIVFYEKDIKSLDIPVIFWSWYDEFSDEIAKLDGRVTFIKKETNRDYLLLAVNEVVKKYNL